ncbi:MAG TPA: hypothetical protein VFT32_09015 [Candidatus Eisenbacteria bacterium]|nr:hypothetical protein [Candidatus Eisenbacteria bacterium]
MNPPAPPDRDSYAIPRVVAGLMALPPTGIALSLLGTQAFKGFDSIGTALGAAGLTMALFCWWFALRGHLSESRVRMRYGVIGGVVLGGIAFAAGFIGPIVFAPDANQGPLLGIFITGPFGFAGGSALGALYGHLRSRR